MTMIQYILDVTLCWAILYFIFYAFLRQVTFFSINRYYLLGSLTLGMLLPLLRNLNITMNKPEVLEIVPLAVMIQQTPTYLTQHIESHPLAEYWSYIIICIYILGVAFFLMRLVKGLNDIRWIYVTGDKVAKENYTLVYSDQEHLPFSFWDVVYISKRVPLTEEINQIITHELNHVHSRHTLDVLYVELLNILFWFNPLIYLYKSAIKQTHEYLADAAVLHQTDKKMYGRILLRQSLSGIQIALAHSFFQSHIKNRINMMYKKKSGRVAWLKYALVLPLVAVLAMAFTEVKKKTKPLPDASQISMNIYPNYSGQYYDINFLGIDKNQLLIKYKNKVSNEVNIKISDGGKSSHLYYKEKIKLKNGTNLLKINIENFQKEDFVVHLNPEGIIWWYDSPILNLSENKVNLTEYVKKDETIYKEVDQMPMFPGCSDITDLKEKKKCSEEKLLMYLYSNLKYPAEARKNDIQGRVYAQFVVEPDGKLSNIKVVRDIGGGCGESVKDVIESMNIMEETWTPGMKDGEIVRVKYTLPVAFKMEDSSDSEATSKSTNQKKSPTNTNVYSVVEEMPRFPGCEGTGNQKEMKTCADKALMSYVYNNILFPETARKQGISGRVYVQFVVDIDGTLDDIKVVRDIGGGCGEAALKMVASMNELKLKWRPGYQEGKPVRVKYTLPITFELTKDIDTLVMYDPVKNTKEAYRLDKDSNTSKLLTPFENLNLKKYANFEAVFQLADFKKANLDPKKVMIRLGGNQYYHSDTARSFSTKDLSEITVYNKKNGQRKLGSIGKNGIIDIQLGGKYLETEEVFDAHQSEGNSIEINYTSSSELPIELFLSDLNGRNIETRTIQMNTSGKTMVTTLNNLRLSSGLYVITIKQGSDLRSKKISYISK